MRSTRISLNSPASRHDMTGNVDEAHTNFAAVRSGKFEVREAEVNRNATPFLFFQAIGVDAGKRLDQRGFAVVNVSCGADNNRLHRVSV